MDEQRATRKLALWTGRTSGGGDEACLTFMLDDETTAQD
jgi:hypothetical protein